MSNDNLRNALRQIGDPYSPGPDFTSLVMKKVRRKVLFRRILNISLTVLVGILISAYSIYLLEPVMSPIVSMMRMLSGKMVLALSGLGALLYLMLLLDAMMRRKFMKKAEP